MGYAFISYSSKNQTSADAMRELFNKHNIDTWMAPYDIPAGSKYAAVITKAIRGCSCFVLLLSNDSQASEAVDSEVELATLTFKKSIITVELEKVILNDAFTFYIHNKQIIAAHKIDEDSREIRQVIEAVRAYTKKNKKGRGLNSVLNEGENSLTQLGNFPKKDKKTIPARQSFEKNPDKSLESQRNEIMDIVEFGIDLLEKDKKSKSEITYDDFLEEYCGASRTSKTLKSKSEYSGLLLGEFPEKFVGKRVDGRYEINEITNEKSGIFIYKAYDNIDCRNVNFYVFSDMYYAQWKRQKLTKKKIKKKILQMIPKLKYNDKCLVVGDNIVYMVRNYDMLDDFAGVDYFLDDMVQKEMW